MFGSTDMLLNVNPDQLQCAYDFICTLEPFNLWAHEENGKPFPHSDTIEFRVTGDVAYWAWKQRKPNGTFIMAYSDHAPSQASNLVMYMAHELIHLYQDINKLETRAMHNRDFHARASRVCGIHGYDYKLFI